MGGERGADRVVGVKPVHQGSVECVEISLLSRPVAASARDDLFVCPAATAAIAIGVDLNGAFTVSHRALGHGELLGRCQDLVGLPRGEVYRAGTAGCGRRVVGTG